MIMANTVSKEFVTEITLLKDAIEQTKNMIIKLSNENARLKQLLENYHHNIESEYATQIKK